MTHWGIESAYVGEKIMSDWIKSTDSLPTENGTCFVFYKNQVILLVWNEYHECWDDETGDDHFCDPTDVSHWMAFSFPDPPIE